MDLTKIVSISGKAGLFKIVSQGKNTVIVESLADQKRFPAFGHEKMSSLEEISVFTTGEDRPLKDIFKAFYEKLDGKETPDPKSDNNILLKFFTEMIPDFDPERVYVSDIRKMMTWFNLLLSQNLLNFTDEPKEKAVAAEVKEESSEQTATDEKKTGVVAETTAIETGKTAIEAEKPADETTQAGPGEQPEKKVSGKKKSE